MDGSGGSQRLTADDSGAPLVRDGQFLSVQEDTGYWNALQCFPCLRCLKLVL